MVGATGPRCLAAIAAILAVLVLGIPQSATAAYGPIELVSKNAKEQADYAAEPAISADGNYVAFCGEIGGREGIFREQVETGKITPVAVRLAEGWTCRSEPYATAPSISADGVYIAFVSSASLSVIGGEGNSEVIATEGRKQVYIADMATVPPTYTLASTRDGTTPLEGGSIAAGRDALSADGQLVAFVNEGNVYVRDVAANETILISARRNQNTGSMEEEPVVGGGAYQRAGAAISADGSTVAWVGERLPEQVPLLTDEEGAIRKIEASAGQEQDTKYHEPLWRRVPSLFDEHPPTRRIVGGGDPLAPGCSVAGNTDEAQCQGPYPRVAFGRPLRPSTTVNFGTGWGLRLPQLDATGDIVALVGDPDEQYDLFVVDMQEGLDRRQAVHQVTQWTNPVPQSTSGIEAIIGGGEHGEYSAFTGEIFECGISADGDHVAFSTTRQRFPGSSVSLLTELPSAPSLLPELYVLDMSNNTLERVTPGSGNDVSVIEGDSGPALERGAASPSLNADGQYVAFASEAENLVVGDGNEASDVFLAESPPPAAVGTSTVSSAPRQSIVPSEWRMTVNAYSRPDGRVRIVAHVPGAGTLRAVAKARLGTRLKVRQVASGRRRSPVTGTVVVNLKLGRGRRSLAHRPGGLVSQVRVGFTGKGGQPLHADLESRFLVHRKRKHGTSHRKGTE